MAETGVTKGFPWPLPDRREEDYADVKKAMAEGQLQTRTPGSDEWKDWSCSGGIGFIYPPDCYRRKPAPPNAEVSGGL